MWHRHQPTEASWSCAILAHVKHQTNVSEKHIVTIHSLPSDVLIAAHNWLSGRNRMGLLCACIPRLHTISQMTPQFISFIPPSSLFSPLFSVSLNVENYLAVNVLLSRKIRFEIRRDWILYIPYEYQWYESILF